MWFYKKLKRTPWIEHMQNGEVFEKMEVHFYLISKQAVDIFQAKNADRALTKRVIFKVRGTEKTTQPT